MNIICFAKQVMDPETPLASFKIDEANNTVMPVQGVAPVVNGFDENAIEAALQLREEHEGTIQVISLGKDLVLDVMKKPLSMGADELYLLQDDALEEGDAYSIARALTAAVKKIGDFDLILCGRQASDTDRGQVGPAVAEMLGIPVVTLARGITVSEGRVTVERVRQDGSEEVVHSKLFTVVHSGERLIVETAGGGGYGNPHERDRQSVQEDVRNRKVSEESAKKDYGLVI